MEDGGFMAMRHTLLDSRLVADHRFYDHEKPFALLATAS